MPVIDKSNIENNKEMVPFEHYVEKFKELNPAEAAERTGIPFDAERGCFSMRLLYTDYSLFWPEFRIESADETALALKSIPAQIFLIRFLLEGCASVGSGAFLTYREMPWGDVYLTPFTGRCLTRAAFTFGTRTNGFLQSSVSLQSSSLRTPESVTPSAALGNFLQTSFRNY